MRANRFFTLIFSINAATRASGARRAFALLATTLIAAWAGPPTPGRAFAASGESGSFGNGGRHETMSFKRDAVKLVEAVIDREKMFLNFAGGRVRARALLRKVRELKVSTLDEPNPSESEAPATEWVPADSVMHGEKVTVAYVLVRWPRYQALRTGDRDATLDADAWALHPYLLASGHDDRDLNLSRAIARALRAETD